MGEVEEPRNWLRRAVAVFQQPPRRLFHALVALPAVALLWTKSLPGIGYLSFMFAFLVLPAAAALWLLRLVVFVWADRNERHTEISARWFLVAPVAGVLTVMLLALHVPLQARWQLSRAAFDREVGHVLHDPDYDFHEHRIGAYRIVIVEKKLDAVLFFEANGNFADDAGFAYMPNGPNPDLADGNFESPEYVHLGGPWYTFNSSW